MMATPSRSSRAASPCFLQIETILRPHRVDLGAYRRKGNHHPVLGTLGGDDGYTVALVQSRLAMFLPRRNVRQDNALRVLLSGYLLQNFSKCLLHEKIVLAVFLRTRTGIQIGIRNTARRGLHRFAIPTDDSW